MKALETANTARNEADRQSSVARKKQAEALASALDAQRQGRLRTAARQARDTAVGEKDQAVGARDVAVGEKNAAVNDKNMAVDAKNKADDQRRTAVLLKDAADHEKKVAVHDKNVAVRAEGRRGHEGRGADSGKRSERGRSGDQSRGGGAAARSPRLVTRSRVATCERGEPDRTGAGARGFGGRCTLTVSSECGGAGRASRHDQAASGLIGHLQFAGHAGPRISITSRCSHTAAPSQPPRRALPSKRVNRRPASTSGIKASAPKIGRTSSRSLSLPATGWDVSRRSSGTCLVDSCSRSKTLTGA